MDRLGSLADAVAGPLAAWYAAHARTLPWRTDPSPWRVLVSEVMLQQTPVHRVLPVYEEWLARWPTPTALAEDTAGQAVRAWGSLGYPRRALRLHATATAVRDTHAGAVPGDTAALRALPGVGEYTAAAVAAFAFGARTPVADVNVRRVLARAAHGHEEPAAASTTAPERADLLALLPDVPAAAPASAALMELGALVCTRRTPRCPACPLASTCRWRAAGHPAHAGPARARVPFAGTDRQVRGRVMAALRATHQPLGPAALDAAWPATAQRERAVASLVSDGLARATPAGLVLVD